MSDDRSDKPDNDGKDSEASAPRTGLQKHTEFGEPLWLDALKTLWVAFVMLVIVAVGGGLLAIAIIAPWGRASHDCSIYCVIDRYFDMNIFGTKNPKKSAGLSPALRDRLRRW